MPLTLAIILIAVAFFTGIFLGGLNEKVNRLIRGANMQGPLFANMVQRMVVMEHALNIVQHETKAEPDTHTEDLKSDG